MADYIFMDHDLDYYQREIVAERERIATRQRNMDEAQYDLDDCFVSVICADLNLRMWERALELAQSGGSAPFLRLADLDGNIVPAKAIRTRYGMSWALLDEQGHFTGQFVAYQPARPATLAKKGYQEIEVQRKACVTLHDNGGRGLGSLGSVHVAVIEDFRDGVYQL